MQHPDQLAVSLLADTHAHNSVLVRGYFAPSSSHSPEYETISIKSKIWPRIWEIMGWLLSCRWASLTKSLGEIIFFLLAVRKSTLWHYTVRYFFFFHSLGIFSNWTFEKCLSEVLFRTWGGNILMFIGPTLKLCSCAPSTVSVRVAIWECFKSCVYSFV